MSHGSKNIHLTGFHILLANFKLNSSVIDFCTYLCMQIKSSNNYVIQQIVHRHLVPVVHMTGPNISEQDIIDLWVTAWWYLRVEPEDGGG